MSEIGFDDGALFQALSEDKHTTVKRKFDKNGNCVSEITTRWTYWDAVMVIGGPALIFGIVNLVKSLGQNIDKWFSEDEQAWIKEHPGLFLAVGPISMKKAFKFVDQAEDQVVALKAVNRLGLYGFAHQIKENWGLTDMAPGDEWKPIEDSKISNWDTIFTLSTGEYLIQFVQADGPNIQTWKYANGKDVGNDMDEVLRLFTQANAEGYTGP